MRVEGKNGIYAELVQYSSDKNNPGSEILTVNVKYGLLIHAEFLRHRQLSRGVKSNRAIPMKNIRKEVITDPYVPVWFGAAKRGMVSTQEVDYKWLARQLWLKSRYVMCGVHWVAQKLGAHKEWANRLLNPWQFVRETITATEWDNLFNLRLHKDAQRDIQEVVECIYQVKARSEPHPLDHGEYHAPYVDKYVLSDMMQHLEGADPVVYRVEGKKVDAETAIKCSAARCARSSYDNHDGTAPILSADLKLYNTLIDSDPAHASPVEHQATPMKCTTVGMSSTLADTVLTKDCDGVTHIDMNGNLWSGNFKGWVQYRQTLDNHTCTNYVVCKEQE